MKEKKLIYQEYETDLEKAVAALDGPAKTARILGVTLPGLRYWLNKPTIERVVPVAFVDPLFNAAISAAPKCGVTRKGLNPASEGMKAVNA